MLRAAVQEGTRERSEIKGKSMSESKVMLETDGRGQAAEGQRIIK